ncbi:uncharacterized protein LOC114685661 isoform X2 [Peromyscus leucopus]|uniref:uncharacterized protein LOC114685661 isoform X2 n=1 Tax=Peromyscus leucopus TaxID=10041 RepID=UPI00188550ED|nr:uncharacterized protein LOC114685661 isoform X2 [Peromyscus leucopus]
MCCALKSIVERESAQQQHHVSEDKVCLSSPGCSESCTEDQAGFKIRDSPDSCSYMLGLKCDIPLKVFRNDRGRVGIAGSFSEESLQRCDAGDLYEPH